MKDPLDRVLRLRALLVNVSRMELEVQVGELARIEQTSAKLRQELRESRRQSFQGFHVSENPMWLEAEMTASLAGWQSQKLEPLRERKLLEVGAAKRVFLDRRKEYRQVECVVETRRAVNELARTRREQRELDDWFNRRTVGNTDGHKSQP